MLGKAKIKHLIYFLLFLATMDTYSHKFLLQE